MTNHPNRSLYQWNNPSVAQRALENVQAGRYTQADVEALVKALIFLSPQHDVAVCVQHGDRANERDEACKAARKALVQLAGE